MPIPYMGSKRKSANLIYNTIVNFNPDIKTLVEPFCGGFAIGEKFVRNGTQVRASDLNKYVIALLDQTINKGLPEEVLNWVSREDFKEVTRNSDKYEDWYVGYVQCIWSFGNSQKSYLFGKDTEPIKKAAHYLVVHKDSSLIDHLLPPKYIKGILKQNTWQSRRMALVKVSKAMKRRDLELQQLERLERLQQLERLERLATFDCHSYDKAKINKGEVVYCDPPYKGTAEYAEGGFNHEKFWDWVRNVSKTNKVYVSEYTAPNDFIKILEFRQKSTLQGGSQQHNNQPNECLFALKGQERFVNI